MKKQSTSWDKFAEWYDKLLNEEGIYQKDVILPNLLRLMDLDKGQVILDLACGQGFFAREFYKKGAYVIGIDISKELVSIARKNSPRELRLEVAKADDLSFLPNESVTKIVIILAIQNIENINGVFKECQRVLRPGGNLYIVMNHPCFRVLKNSEWGWDEKNKTQYRRINSYMSESKIEVQMHPGENPKDYSISFHRPLQYYFKLLSNNKFQVNRLEEWISNKKSQPGPRASAENQARKEFPLFLYIEANKKSS